MSRLIPLSERYEPEPNTECHIWTGVVGHGGYGRVKRKNKNREAHRIAWEAKHGPIPDGMQIHHLCENKLCVNDMHLRIVSPSEHATIYRTARSIATANASKTHCPNGHKYDEGNTMKWGGRRYCRACAKKYQRDK